MAWEVLLMGTLLVKNHQTRLLLLGVVWCLLVIVLFRRLVWTDILKRGSRGFGVITYLILFISSPSDPLFSASFFYCLTLAMISDWPLRVWVGLLLW